MKALLKDFDKASEELARSFWELRIFGGHEHLPCWLDLSDKEREKKISNAKTYMQQNLGITQMSLDEMTDKFLAEERARIKRRLEADSQVAGWVKERLSGILNEE